MNTAAAIGGALQPVVGLSRAGRRRSDRYLDELVRLRCAPDLLNPRFKLFPNAKEVTESFAAFNAARGFFGDWFKRRDVWVFCVGDGCRPRTAATFAFRTRWTAVSIDPALRSQNEITAIDRLALRPERIEAMPNVRFKRALIVAVHSHAPLEAALERIEAQHLGVIAIPCCKPQNGPGEPIADYFDLGIHSPMNRVVVWREGPNG